MSELAVATPAGIYCPRGDFYIDPWEPVSSAVVTHAHADHYCAGCERYLTSDVGRALLKLRLGDEAVVDGLEFGETMLRNGVQISLHPSGHILGSAQVRIESQGEVCVISGDYKLAPDPTCAAFEPISCHTFITEATFGLPVYRWAEASTTLAEIGVWRERNRSEGRGSVLFAYAMGKAQRLLAGLGEGAGPVLCHGAVERLNDVYRQASSDIPPTLHASEVTDRKTLREALIVAPPSAQRSPWLRRFGDVGTAFVSGWMQVRGARRRRAVDRGFVLSDHADWQGLLDAVDATGAQRVLVTHGLTGPFVRHLRELGFDADELATTYGSVSEEFDEAAPDEVREASQ
ncbi:MAG: ligase-associated DNA damage response exonuclease [Planctomycetales bacterium]|nr:ligase-associated DNA damage response exonuclease [Planctomycetales bacterium]